MRFPDGPMRHLSDGVVSDHLLLADWFGGGFVGRE